ncbi:MAG TPA: histidine phosphatase family protein [Burkholderiaceae bacterium]|nr:histidine phosphatase family protein [Burkholderiaceae bacterium]
MRVFLIRHPRPQVAPDICYGASDVDLADHALDCAAALRAALPAQVPLFSSPLLRCRRLAEALHPAPSYDGRLREMDFGAWELRGWNEIARAELDAWAAAPMAYAPPGGESVSQVCARVAAFLAEHIGAGRQDFAVVTHAGVMRIMAARLRGLDRETWFGLRFGYGELTLLDVPAGRS